MPAERSIESKYNPLESEMLVAVRYNDVAQHLDVIFRTGEKYRYLHVPRSEYEGLMNAESHGQYMHKHILGDRYEFVRLN